MPAEVEAGIHAAAHGGANLPQNGALREPRLPPPPQPAPPEPTRSGRRLPRWPGFGWQRSNAHASLRAALGGR